MLSAGSLPKPKFTIKNIPDETSKAISVKVPIHVAPLSGESGNLKKSVPSVKISRKPTIVKISKMNKKIIPSCHEKTSFHDTVKSTAPNHDDLIQEYLCGIIVWLDISTMMIYDDDLTLMGHITDDKQIIWDKKHLL